MVLLVVSDNQTSLLQFKVTRHWEIMANCSDICSPVYYWCCLWLFALALLRFLQLKQYASDESQFVFYWTPKFLLIIHIWICLTGYGWWRRQWHEHRNQVIPWRLVLRGWWRATYMVQCWCQSWRRDWPGSLCWRWHRCWASHELLPSNDQDLEETVLLTPSRQRHIHPASDPKYRDDQLLNVC